MNPSEGEYPSSYLHTLREMGGRGKSKKREVGNKRLWRRGGVQGWGGPGRAQRRRKRLCLLTGGVAGSQTSCTEPACLALYYRVYSRSAENPLPLPPPPLSHCEHVEGITANMQCLHTLREATQQNTYTNTAYGRTPHSECSSHNHPVSHARHTNTWCLL